MATDGGRSHLRVHVLLQRRHEDERFEVLPASLRALAARVALAEDLARLKALTLPTGVRLRLDPNQSWGTLDPTVVAKALTSLPIEYIEEPEAWPGLARPGFGMVWLGLGRAKSNQNDDFRAKKYSK